MKSTQKHFGKFILFLLLVMGAFAAAQYFLIYKNRVVQSNPQSSLGSPKSSDSQAPISSDFSTQNNIENSDLFDKAIPLEDLTFRDHVAIQAELRLQSDVTYDGAYHKIAYPMGDVPDHIGVCTDVVIRSFRGLGVDLQERVHEDMKRNFRSYPKKWRLTKPDTNIDHRRVLNLMTYFDREGASLNISEDPLDYYAGNIVTWDLGKGLYHIGIVSNYVSEHTNNPLIVHNIGAGPQMNDMLFDYKIIGHYQSDIFSE